MNATTTGISNVHSVYVNDSNLSTVSGTQINGTQINGTQINNYNANAGKLCWTPHRVLI